MPKLAEWLRGSGRRRARRISKLVVRGGQRLQLASYLRLDRCQCEREFLRRLARRSRAALLAAPRFQRIERVADKLRPRHSTRVAGRERVGKRGKGNRRR